MPRKEAKRLRVTTYFQRKRQKRSNEQIQKEAKNPYQEKKQRE